STGDSCNSLRLPLDRNYDRAICRREDESLMAGDLEVVGGIVLALARVLQVWNATRIHAFFSRRNEGQDAVATRRARLERKYGSEIRNRRNRRWLDPSPRRMVPNVMNPQALVLLVWLGDALGERTTSLPLMECAPASPRGRLSFPLKPDDVDPVPVVTSGRIVTTCEGIEQLDLPIGSHP